MKVSLLWYYILSVLLQMLVTSALVIFAGFEMVSVEVILFVAFVITWAHNEESKK